MLKLECWIKYITYVQLLGTSEARGMRFGRMANWNYEGAKKLRRQIHELKIDYVVRMDKMRGMCVCVFENIYNLII